MRGQFDHCDSFLCNCTIMPAPDQATPMFDINPMNGNILARLDGYAIIPMEEYSEMRRRIGQLQSLLRDRDTT